jgi:hypothetical protein
MKLRLVDILLLAVIAVGCVYVWNTGQERSRLTAHYARLTAITGDLKITDPTKVHIQALETDDPMHFAWRVYYPPNYKQLLQSNNGYGGTQWSRESQEFIARVRFRPNGDGDMEVYTRFAGGSSQGTFGNKQLAKLLVDHWDTIDVEQLGATGLTTLEPDKSAVILRLSLSKEVEAQARTTLSPYMQERFVPVFYELGLGPKSAKP